AKIADLERLAVKLAVDRIGPREIASLRSSLAELPGLDDALKACPDKGAREALELPAKEKTSRVPPSADPRQKETGVAFLDRCEDMHALLDRAIADDPPLRASEGGVFKDGYDAELDEARTIAKDGQRLIVDLEGRCREESAISSLKLRYTR